MAKGTRLLMHDGTLKLIEDVVIGDKLMGPDSKYRKVLSTCTGFGKMFKVTPKKGDSYVVNEDHVLSLRHLKDPFIGNKAPIVNISIRDYLKQSKKFKDTHRGWRTGVDWESRSHLPIDPYLIGLWLGDGCMNKACITTGDVEIKEYLFNFAKSNGLGVRVSPNSENSENIFIKKLINETTYLNPLKKVLKDLGILNNKHIPHVYKTASRLDRLKLLAGLVDTDGYLHRKGFSFTLKSEKLLDDIVFLARSLGFSAYKTVVSKKCHNNDKIGVYYATGIYGATDQIPCRVARKKSGVRTILKSPTSVGISVEQVEDNDYYGFELSGDGLYLLDDFTVTHNTAIFSSIVSNEPGGSVVLAHRAELVMQISLTLGFWKVQHRIIGPKALVNACIDQHIIEFGKNYINPSAKCAVASVYTLVKMNKSDPWLRNVRLWVTDECFPAGTLIDGRPIETLRVGDTVAAFDEKTGRFERHKINHVFKNKAPDCMVSIESESRHVICSTLNHPIWTKRGWVEAKNITINDEILIYDTLYDLREGGGHPHLPPKTQILKNRSCFLSWKDMFCRVLSSPFVRNNGENKSCSCVLSNDEQQPYAERGVPSESIGNVETNRSQADTSRRQWEARSSGRKSGKRVINWAGFPRTICDSYEIARTWISSSLQNRLGKPTLKDSDRNRRGVSRLTVSEGAGLSKRAVSYWSRVASVTIQEQRSSANTTDGFVYNFEVDKLNTYTANGIVVHNCHHCIKGGIWEVAIGMFPNARGLGVTATPFRADGKGLGRHADGFFDVLIEGPGPRELIDMNRLVDYRIFAPPSDLNLSGIQVSASGEFQRDPLRAAVHKSHLVGDVVGHYLKYAPGKLGLTFTVDVEAAEEQARAFNSFGIPTEAVSAETDSITRRNAIRKLKRGDLKMLTNCDLFGEGTDLPAVETAIFARPTASEPLFIQQFCRPMRMSDGKDHAIIIDPVHNIRINYGHVTIGRHPLPDAAKVYTLDRQEKRGRSETVPSMVRTCLECLAVYDKVRHGMICPYCKTAHVPAQRSGPEFVDGDLGEVDPAVLERSRQLIADLVKPPKIPRGASQVVINSIMKNHRERVSALNKLNEAILYDARHVIDPREYQRAFYLKHGIDVLTARTLGTKEALKLKERIEQ